MKQGIEEKWGRLKQLLSQYTKLIVAYSGGVDSTLLLAAAREVLGDRVLAVVFQADIFSRKETEQALQTARAMGVPVIDIVVNPLENPSFTANSKERCYYCKKQMCQQLKQIAIEKGYPDIAHGDNVSDRDDWRPGNRAAAEYGVRAPLAEAGLIKEEIRALAGKLKLKTWNKPAIACLATRFPYGEEITAEKIRQVEQAEEYIAGMGFNNIRVRVHDRLARIEVDAEQIGRLARRPIRDKIIKKLKELGFVYTTVDLEGFRSGSMNIPLNKRRKR